MPKSTGHAHFVAERRPDMWNMITTLFREYMGTGLIIGWYLLCLVFLWLKEKDIKKRILFAYMPAIMLVLYFNPVFAKVIYAAVGDEIYYRLLWLLPITVTIAYSVTVLYGQIKGRKKGLFAICCACLLMISGKCIYADVNFHRAQNLYHVPDAVVEICDEIRVEGREVMAVFPMELMQYVRQYSAWVCMPYGREMMVGRWGNHDDLYDVMEAPVLELDKLAPLTKERLCHFVVLPQGKEVTGNWADYEFEYIGTFSGYTVYQDMSIYAGL